MNINYNHNPDCNYVEVSKSVETIYKNAVQKRMSSLSEECVDISDENLALIPDADFQPDYEGDVPGNVGEISEQPQLCTSTQPSSRDEVSHHSETRPNKGSRKSRSQVIQPMSLRLTVAETAQ